MSMTTAAGPELVVLTDSDLPEYVMGEEILRAADLPICRAECRSEEDVIEAAREATALIVQWAPITGRVLEQLPRCRFVSRLGVGYDMIDVGAASSRGVAVANTADYCTGEVAAHAVGFMLHLARDLGELDTEVRGGGWTATRPTMRRPAETTVALLGCGRIGSRVAAAMRALGFELLVHDTAPEPEAARHSGVRSVGFEEALAAANLLSLHLPLTPSTHHILDAAAIAEMKPGACVVNTARGGLVDERALVDALEQGRLAGAALDVFENEPLAADSPLRRAPNLLLSPHAAWYSPTAVAALQAKAEAQVVDFLAGEEIATIVNPDYVRHAR